MVASARELVLQYGWNSTSYQILNPGIEHWFAAERAGVVGFVRRPGAWIAAGAPVCAAEAMPAVAAAFERAAAAADRRVCYVCAADRLAAHLGRSPGHAVVAIGAQPVWDPADWGEIIGGRPSLRAQLHRARNKGVRIAPWWPGGAVPESALRECLREWLATRHMPPMGFLVEPGTLDGPLADRLILVATVHGKAVAFLIASPVPLRNGYLIEQIARSPRAPNGTAELLIDATMEHLATQGSTYVTMGLVALSSHAGGAMGDNPMWLRAVTGWARAHGRRFYNFDGLERFRAKMAPQSWETIYAIANQPRFTPATLWSMTAAFTHGSPLRAVAGALSKAVATEAGWLWHARGRG